MPKRKHIDYTDIPKTDEIFWENAEVHLPKRKQQVTLRLDTEVLEWFQEEGPGYQTKINAILKTYVKAHPHTQHL